MFYVAFYDVQYVPEDDKDRSHTRPGCDKLCARKYNFNITVLNYMIYI